MNVSKRIITLRERCGLTQNGLAERAGVSQTHLRRVELGQADITIGYLQLLCDAMNISIQDFFQDESNSDDMAVFSKLSPKQKKCAAKLQASSAHEKCSSIAATQSIFFCLKISVRKQSVHFYQK